MKLKFVLYIVILIMFTNSILAIGIGSVGGPGKLINFKPGDKKTYTYSIKANRPPLVLDYDITVSGKLSEYITVEPKYIKNIKNPAILNFKVHVNLPETLIEQGQITNFVTVTEVPTSSLNSGGTGSIGSARGKIIINMPYEGYKINSELNAPNLNENDIAKMQISVQNLGTNLIDKISATINVFDDQQNSITTLYTNELSVGYFEQIFLEADFDSTGFPPGKYTATAIINYDGQPEENLSDSFFVGTKNIGVMSHTTRLIAGIIAPFDVRVKSNWNNNVNIYAKIFIDDLITQTPTIKLDKMGMGTLSTYLDSQSLTSGNKDLRITLFYDGSSSNYKGNVTVLSQEEFQKSQDEKKPSTFDGDTNWMLIGAVTVLVLLNILVLIVLKKRKKKQQTQW
ncbi:hypothetical protein HN587_04055 [Candidatus Woesearchaeota archaeon]|jgi:hypothetical protein|nr:hypothetical protein [Candidatus Woesearchaeota archaeon]